MGVRFYIGSALENYETVRRVAKVLEAAGHTWTYDWTKRAELEIGPQHYPLNSDEDFILSRDISTIGALERDGVLEADIFVLILPGYRGAHTELGIALGACGKFGAIDAIKVIICAEKEEELSDDQGRPCPFYHLTWNVERVVGTMDVWLEKILYAAKWIC